jgi:DNA end-binding protein Ku
VTPQADTARAYEVLLKALAEAKKAAVVTFVLAGRQHHAVLRADDGVMALHTLYYADEVRQAEATWKRPVPAPEEVKLAREFIEALAKPFDPSQYHDEYRGRLAALIQAEAEGQPINLPPAGPTPAKVVNLIEQVRKPPTKAVAASGQAKERRAEPARRATGGRRGRVA